VSDLHVGQIKRHLEETYLPYVDLTGANQEHHNLSRAIAALALSERTGLPASTAGGSVTDHSLDGGIDGVAYAADRATLVLVQSKWTASANTGIALGDVLKFVEGVRHLVRNDWTGFGGPIKDRQAEIEDILFQAGTKLELVVVTSGTSGLATQQQAALESFCAQMNDSTEIASYIYLNQERLYAMIASTRSAQIDLSINLRNWGVYQETGCVAYYGTASAQDVVKWYQDHGDLLFSRNIRGALVGTEVNDGIMTTARKDPSRFWFFNNGITVITESCEQAPYVNQKSGNFSFRRANVINGAQTVSSLARAAVEEPSLLESADVFLRFVTLDDPDGEFARLVTRRTNTQNRVGGREFVALDPEQERIRMEFAVSGLRYAYRSGETVSDPSKGCDLTDATIALACAHGISEMVLAKREISRLWESTSRAPYIALFNRSVTGSRVWVAVELMRWVDQQLELERAKFDGRERLIVVQGNRLILWAIMAYLHLNDLNIDDFKPPFSKHQVEELVIAGTQRLIEIVFENYPEAYPQPLFKNQAKCKILGSNLQYWLTATIDGN
jgi:hypothetical protein